MKQLIALLLGIALLTSCKISQQYYFNDDFSGKYKLAFDLSEMADVDNNVDPDSIPDLFEDLDVDSIKEVYNHMEGISKVKVKTEDNILYVSYQFEDLEALNKSISGDLPSEFGMEENAHFSFENDVFAYHFNTDQIADSIAELMVYMQYDIIMAFEKEIAKTSNGHLDAEKNRILLSGSLGDVAKKEKSLNVKVEFK